MWNTNNEVYFNYMAICGVGGAPRTAIVVAKSTDGGATWNPLSIIRDSWATVRSTTSLSSPSTTTPPTPIPAASTPAGRDGNQKVAFSSNAGLAWTEKDIPVYP